MVLRCCRGGGVVASLVYDVEYDVIVEYDVSLEDGVSLEYFVFVAPKERKIKKNTN